MFSQMPPSWLIWVAILFALGPTAIYLLRIVLKLFGMTFGKIFGENDFSYQTTLPADSEMSKPAKIMVGAALLAFIVFCFTFR